MMFQKKLAELFGARRRKSSRRPAAPRRALVSLCQLEGREVPAAISLSSAYSQNFDGALSGTTAFAPADFRNETPNAPSLNGNDPNAATAEGTVKDWYAFQGESNQEPGFYTVAVPGALGVVQGLSPAGGVYSMVSTSGAADRSLGSIGSNSVANQHFAIEFVNDTGSPVTKLNVSYTGEQWNKANSSKQVLRVYYSTNAEAPYGPDAFDFVEVPTLNFTTPQTLTSGSTVGIDGNATGNFTAISGVIDLDAAGRALEPGETIWVRWTDPNDSGNDHAVAIDNIQISAVTGTPANPSRNPAFAVTGSTGTIYSQNFNSGLPTTDGSSVAFTPFSTIDAGFTILGQKQASAPGSIFGDDGDNNAGNPYSYGTSGNSDRALGSIGSDNAVAGGFTHVLRLRNDSGVTINRLSVGYTGEQWRFGGNVDDPQRLQVQYSISDGSFKSDQGNWVDVPALDFVSPVQSNPNASYPTVPPRTATKLDGNNAANRQALSAILSGIGGGTGGKLDWNPGEELTIRWIDINNDGVDNALAIDDIAIAVDTGTAAGAEYNPVGMDGITALSQPFDSLANQGTTGANNPVAWDQGKTLTGWFSQVGNTGSVPSTYRVSDGADGTGTIYSYGEDFNSPTNRALGSIGSNNNANGSVANGVALRNDAAMTVNSLSVAFANEQWRRGENRNPETMLFQISDDGGLTWTTVHNLSTTTKNPSSVLTSDPVATGLEGNQSANRTSVSSTVTGLNIAAGEIFFIRWVDPNNVGADHGVSIDDVELQLA